MSDQMSWLFSSIPVPFPGTIRVRMNVLFIALAAVFMFRIGILLGFVFTSLILLSVFLHELGHVVAARLTGGSANEIHISPIGGLAQVHMAPDSTAKLLTILAGPFVNLLMCSVAFPVFYSTVNLWQTLNPMVLPITTIQSETWVTDVLLLLFAVNWILLLLNLLPVLPLDGGQVLRVLMARQTHPELVTRDVAQIGMIFSVLMMAVGWMGNWSTVVVIGAILMVVNLLLIVDEDSARDDEEMFLGYDFSEGYTSLDRSAPSMETPSKESRPGLFQRWRDERRQKKELEEHRLREEAEQKLDSLLAKVHEKGMDSLTASEKRQLKTVSDLLRDKGKRS